MSILGSYQLLSEFLILRAMVKQKGGGGGGALPHASVELTNVEFDLQVHMDEITAKTGALQATLNTYQESFNSFRTDTFYKAQLCSSC
ncbi:hypothetical protein RchiOBHm_Chr6g0249291 [Rosa chinensis]|uniref:Uncharacterized protein n=1 Tax=Rosa chinensis TaxID=74649 RepID=A0A2P6PKA9_ROSCH|nr:hypothetical protein RchiOBHm_Chr6g0249291 [Rosa chinensis]